MLMVMRRRFAGDDRGAVAVIVIVLFASMAVFALGALAIDTGQFYAEKAQLQNGADAGALAAAKSCAKSDCILADLTPIAQGFADKNANDDASNVEEICGSDGLPSCIPNLCPDGTGLKHWVDVQLSTEQANGDKALPAFFGKAVLGNKYKGDIHACAQAQWGPPGGGTGLALTMSICDWLADTGATVAGDPNATYATPEPPYPASGWPPAYPGTVDKDHPAVPNVGGENVVQIHGSGKCGAGESGADVPGGFGWLSNDPNGSMPTNCQVQTDANGYVYENPGGLGGKNSDCAVQLQAIYDASNGKTIPNTANPIFIPVFDLACNSTHKLEPAGTTECPATMPKGSFHVAGYAEFVLTGLDYNPLSDKSLINGANACKGGSFSCLYGLFTKGLVSQQDLKICTLDPCPSFGPTVAELTG